jgi:hypothetical protein
MMYLFAVINHEHEKNLTLSSKQLKRIVLSHGGKNPVYMNEATFNLTHPKTKKFKGK